MRNFHVLAEAIEYIEENLCERIYRNQVAEHCFVSLSMLEKLFRYSLNKSIGEYINQRKISKAAYDLKNTELSVTEIAMKYNYNSHEVFIRSFKKIWNMTPSQYVKRWNFSQLYPKINFKYNKGEDLEMARKKVDMSEAYDYFNKNIGKYVICFDICGLIGINEISVKAGDLAILEAASRINDIADDDMLMLRIGGDEFALITGLDDENIVKRMVERVASQNGKEISFQGLKIPLSLHSGVTKISKDRLRYNELFNDLHEVINHSKS